MERIVNAMARAMFVCAWADLEEENGRTYPGQELMDVAPETPEDAVFQAWRLAGQFEALNRDNLAALFARALKVDGKMSIDWTTLEWEHCFEKYADEFGHYLAMRALGHGVCWEDSHRECRIKYPHFEYYLE